MSSPHSSLRYEAYASQLANCGHNTYSQFGEDGLIRELLRLIGTENQWCFEIGAADGVFYSNSLQWREQGWQSVLIESSGPQFAKLIDFENEKTHVVHETATDLDEILSRYDTPVDLDLGVIDIDGQDYWLWHDMTVYRPRVMLVEFCWQNGDDFIPPRSETDKRQAGEQAMRALAEWKGYDVVAKTYVNLLCVRKDIDGWKTSQSS